MDGAVGSMKNSVEVSRLKKKFKEKGHVTWALKGIDLRIKEGEVFGLLGPNGAGKTTAIYIMSTLLLPTDGRVKVMGLDVVEDAGEVRKRIGLCMGGTRLYRDFSARENLEYFGRLLGMDRETRRRNSDGLIDKLDITNFQHRALGDLSTGMRQKVAVAKALLNDPEVLFLDEPTAGLDVEVAADIRQFIMDMVKEKRMTVILTSHQLYEVEEMCDRIALLDEGSIIAEGRIEDIRKKLGFPDVIHLYLNRYSGLGFLNKVSGVLDFDVADGLHIEVESGIKNLNTILSALKRKGYRVRDMEVKKADLKDMFLKIVRDSHRR